MANTTDTDKSGSEIKDPQDFLNENDNKVLVDFTEVYEKEGGKDIDILIDGLEQYQNGKLSHKVNKILKVNFEPGITSFNARMGSESFITTIKDGFLNFIKAIIKYVQMAYNWIVNGIRFILGFDKSDRRQKEYQKLRVGLKDEIIEVLTKLGLPSNLYDIGKLMDSVPEASSRIETLQFIHNKLQTDSAAIDNLTKVVPILNNLVTECANTIRDVNFYRNKVSKKIQDIQQRIKRNQVSALDAKELEIVITECRDHANFKKISSTLTKVIESLYGISVQEVNGEINFEALTAQFKDKVEVVRSKVKSDEASDLQSRINSLEAEILNDDTLRKIKDLDNVTVELFKKFTFNEASVIEALANAIGDPSIKRPYLIMSKELKMFSTSVNEIVKIVKDVKLNAEALIKWRNKAEVLLQTYISEDLDTIRKHLAELRATGEIDYSVMARDGTPMKYVLNDEISPQTYVEKITEFNKFMIDADILGIKKKVSNFRSQLGL